MSVKNQKHGCITSNETHEINCMKCNRNDSWNDMVQCDKCDNYEHFMCAGVDSQIINRSWICQACGDYDDVSNNCEKRDRDKGDEVQREKTSCSECKCLVEESKAFLDPMTKQILCARCYNQFFPALSQLSKGFEQRICQRCGESILEKGVKCKSCRFSFHELCAGVLEEAGGGDLMHWKCDVCRSGVKHDQLSVASSLRANKDQKESVRVAVSHTTTSSKRIEMERIEEERVLAIERLREWQKKRREREEEEALVLEQIDKIYIDSKYDLSSSKSSISRSSKGVTCRFYFSSFR